MTRRTLMDPVLLAALIASLWLLSVQLLGPWLVDALSEMHVLLAVMSAGTAIMITGGLGISRLLRARAGTRRTAALPLAICVAALVLSAAFAPLVQEIDFRRHFDVRAEVVQRIEAGQIWNGSPSHSFVSLPWPDYPRSVSDGAGQRGITVYRESGALHVLFHPAAPPVLLGPRYAIMYRSDGLPPTLPNNVLPDAAFSQPMGDRWHRVFFR